MAQIIARLEEDMSQPTAPACKETTLQELIDALRGSQEQDR